MNAHNLGKPKIGIVLNSAYRGGSELALLETVKGLHQAGYQLYVVVPDTGPLLEGLKPYCADVQIIQHNWWASTPPVIGLFTRLKFLRGYYRASKSIAAYFTAQQVDVIISNSVVIPSGALAAKVAKLPHIWYLHEFGAEDHGFTFFYGKRWSLHSIGKWSTHAIANSEAVFQYFKKYLGTKLTKLYYAVEMPATSLRVQPVITGRALRLIVTGRIAPNKGQNDALEATILLNEQGILTELYLQGSFQEDYKLELIRKAEKAGITDKLIFLPHSDDPFAAVRQSDIALVCSKLEAFGRVTVEAMKLGVPIVATSTAGSKELVGVQEERGLFYSPGQAAELAQQISRYYYDRNLRTEKATAAYKYAWQVCNMETHTKAVESVLEKVLRY